MTRESGESLPRYVVRRVVVASSWRIRSRRTRLHWWWRRRRARWIALYRRTAWTV